MGILDFLLLLLIAGICGSIAQALVGYSHGGCLASIALGFIGAVIGIWIARLAKLPELFELRIGGHGFPIIWSIFGASLFVAVLAFLAGSRRR